MKFRYLNGFLLTMYFLSIFWTAGAPRVVAQSDLELSPAPRQVQTTEPSEPAREVFSPSSEQSQFKGWFNRSGSGLFISLTPFATAVSLAILVLAILLPILIGAASRRRSRGYFKTYPHARQEVWK